MMTGRAFDRLGASMIRLERLPLLAVVYLVVKYHAGMSSVIRIHDTLDGSQAVLSRMSLGDLFSAPGSTLDFMLGGLPRASVGSELFVGNIIAVTFPLLWSLLLAEVIYRGIAFYGMRRLLGDTGLASSRLVLYAVPTLFSIFPFWHPGFASVAGIPLLASALIRLHRGAGRGEMAIVVLFPLLAQPSATIPYVIMLSLYAVIGWLTRQVPRRVVGVIAGFGAVLAASEWRQVYSLLAGPASHRSEMTSTPAGLSTQVFKMGRALLETVEKHSFDAPATIVPLATVLIVGVLVATLVRRSRERPADAVLWLTLVAMVGVLLASGAWRFIDRAVRAVAGDYPRFQVDRGVWALPGLTYLALAAAAVLLVRWASARIAVPLLLIVFVVQGVALWQKADFDPDTWEQMTLEEFYAPDLFGQVRDLVGDEAVVVAVGFHPAVSVYNGLSTADGYAASYPLDYKHRFRELIAPVLDADPSLRAYFDEWGSRAYLFQSGLPAEAAWRGDAVAPIELSADPAAFGHLGITHVLSVAEITNAEELGLDLVGVVGDPGSRRTIWVYAT